MISRSYCEVAHTCSWPKLDIFPLVNMWRYNCKHFICNNIGHRVIKHVKVPASMRGYSIVDLPIAGCFRNIARVIANSGTLINPVVSPEIDLVTIANGPTFMMLKMRPTLDNGLPQRRICRSCNDSSLRPSIPTILSYHYIPPQALFICH
ncbi:hypothetical protein QL285_050244 [Trifolium repens]|nr:hypothetical protein QL285_050244 [Trifolium repens]